MTDGVYKHLKQVLQNFVFGNFNFLNNTVEFYTSILV